MFSMSVDMGIDLGTASVLVYIKGRGIVLKEPSVVAFDREANEIKEIGEEARKMIEEAEDKLKDIESLDEETRFAFETKLAAAKARIDVFEHASHDTPQAENGFSTFVEPIKK